MSERARVVNKTYETSKGKSVSKTDSSSKTASSTADNIKLLHQTLGNQTIQRLYKSGKVQAALKIGQPNDAYEQEADRIADKVMRMPSPSLNRKCSSCGKDDELNIRRKPESTGSDSSVPDNFVSSLGAGQPLDKATRDYFEPRFSADFSHVRVHAGRHAAESASAINARAYTLGNSVVFGAGQYKPNTIQGKGLLAHELTHVVQQSENCIGVINRKECSATRVCSPQDRCSQPDIGEEGTAMPSTWWTLTVNVDIERDSFEDSLRAGKLGHTNVRFSESNGKQYTYGFYPADAIPNENMRSVDGCINHPDTSHDSCIDTTRTFFLTQPQYTAALSYAQDFCRTRHYYGLNSANVSYTCTTFAGDVARAAGQSLPNMTSAPTTIFYQAIPAIDNPNTLNENLATTNQGMASSELEVLSIAEMGGPRLLERYPWQEKVRWITILLDETWITDRDVAAIERVCIVGTNSSDLTKIRAAITPLLSNMNSSSQRTRVENALR